MLGFILFKLADIHGIHIVALGLNANLAVIIGSNHGYNIEVNAAGKHAAVLMIGMVAAHLCSAGGGEKANIIPFRKYIAKAVTRGGIARAGGAHIAVKH